MNKLISYYDLLGMIKEKNIPDKVYWVTNSKEKILFDAEYDFDEFSHYYLNEENCRSAISNYLGENFLESDMFNECIEIPNDDFEDIEEIDLGILNQQSEKNREFRIKINQLIKNQRKIINMLKEN